MKMPPGRPGDIDCSGDERIVKQEFAKDCDVNLIIARCLRNGAPLPVREGLAPIFADVSQFGDYRTVVERVRAADEAFMALDANVRKRFDNDPGLLMSFLADSANKAEAEGLGLLVKPEVAVEPPVDPPAPAPKGKAKPVAKPVAKLPEEVTPEES